jgi:hypothetical protein
MPGRRKSVCQHLEFSNRRIFRYLACIITVELMMFEMIGYMWLILAGIISFGALRATYREWGYNINITPGANMTKQNRANQIRTLKAVRGIDRDHHFKSGGSLVSWRGGTRTVTADRKKKKNKNACRGKWRGE